MIRPLINISFHVPVPAQALTSAARGSQPTSKTSHQQRATTHTHTNTHTHTHTHTDTYTETHIQADTHKHRYNHTTTENAVHSTQQQMKVLITLCAAQKNIC